MSSFPSSKRRTFNSFGSSAAMAVAPDATVAAAAGGFLSSMTEICDLPASLNDDVDAAAIAHISLPPMRDSWNP